VIRQLAENLATINPPKSAIGGRRWILDVLSPQNSVRQEEQKHEQQNSHFDKNLQRKEEMRIDELPLIEKLRKNPGKIVRLGKSRRTPCKPGLTQIQ